MIKGWLVDEEYDEEDEIGETVSNDGDDLLAI